MGCLSRFREHWPGLSSALECILPARRSNTFLRRCGDFSYNSSFYHLAFTLGRAPLGFGLLRERQDHRRGVVKSRQIADIQRDLAVGFKASQRNLSQLVIDARDRRLKLIF